MLFEQFPYTNFHEINLDWLLKRVKEMETEFEDYKASITNIIKENLSEIAFSAIYNAGERTIYLNLGKQSKLDSHNRVQALKRMKAEPLVEVMRDE